MTKIDTTINTITSLLDDESMEHQQMMGLAIWRRNPLVDMSISMILDASRPPHERETPLMTLLNSAFAAGFEYGKVVIAREILQSRQQQREQQQRQSQPEAKHGNDQTGNAKV